MDSTDKSCAGEQVSLADWLKHHKHVQIMAHPEDCGKGLFEAAMMAGIPLVPSALMPEGKPVFIDVALMTPRMDGMIEHMLMHPSVDHPLLGFVAQQDPPAMVPIEPRFGYMENFNFVCRRTLSKDRRVLRRIHRESTRYTPRYYEQKRAK